MAARKKAAKKTATKRAPSTKYTMPEGFTLPASANVPNWEMEKKPVLAGTLIAVKEVKLKKPQNGKKTTRVATIRDGESGSLVQVWESGWLHGFFDEVQEGAEVHLIFRGFGEKQKGKNPARIIEAGFINPEGGKRSKKR